MARWPIGGRGAAGTYHRPGFFGFFRRDFSRMARARVSCPTFSSSRESRSHRGVECGHFFNYRQQRQAGVGSADVREGL